MAAPGLLGAAPPPQLPPPSHDKDKGQGDMDIENHSDEVGYGDELVELVNTTDININ